MGRLLAPWYTYIVHPDPPVANFYKRLVRDVVRFDEPRVTRHRGVRPKVPPRKSPLARYLFCFEPAPRFRCAAGQVVAWLRAAYGGDFAAVHARRNEFQFVETSKNLGAAHLRDVVLRGAAPNQTVYVASDEKDLTFFDAIRAAGRPVVLLAELLGRARNRSSSASDGEEKEGGTTRPDGARWPPDAVLDALLDLNGNELSFVDALVASQGTTFTGSWFSTYSSFIHRVRGFAGFPDNASFFTAPDRWAAFQGYEPFRSPLYMREWPDAWRGIDGDADAAAYPWERVFTPDVSKTGYPTDHLDPRRLLPMGGEVLA